MSSNTASYFLNLRHTVNRTFTSVAKLAIPLTILSTLIQPASAGDAPEPFGVQIPAPGGLDWDDLLDALSDGKITPSDAIDPFARELWRSVGALLAQKHICTLARYHYHLHGSSGSTKGPILFDITITIVDKSGKKTSSYKTPVRVSAVPGGKRLAVGVYRLGSDAIQQVFNCKA